MELLARFGTPVGPQPALGVTWPNLNGSGPGPRTGEPPYRTTPLYNKDYKLGSVDLGMGSFVWLYEPSLSMHGLCLICDHQIWAERLHQRGTDLLYGWCGACTAY